MEDEIYQKLLDRAFRLLSIRPRAEYELRRRLTRVSLKKKEAVEKVIARLKQLDLVNDYRFARWWVESRKRTRPKGRIAIKHELLAQGVARSIVDEVLKDAYSKEEEYEKARALFEKKLPLYQEVSKKKAYRRLYQLLFRRGFKKEVIDKVIDEVLPKSYNIS